MNLNRSDKLFKEAQKLIPGGVNSPVRAFKEIGINPPFIAKAQGSRVYDEDGNEYIDFVGSWGPMILGHNHPGIKKALGKQLELGTSYGAPTALEVETAGIITEIVPSVEMIRMVNSGTEATMSALRLARAYTKREKIVKFAGNYHGHHVIENTITADYNDTEGIKAIFRESGAQIATVILEPVSGNMGVVPAKQEFLDNLRAITQKYGSLLIFDEVMTGFRVALGGAQSLYNIKPDLTCFGKIIGGGLPVGAYGGKREIMEMVAPLGPVYQAGTLSGNPLAMTAGLTALKILRENPEIYIQLEKKAKRLQEGLETDIMEARINRVGSMMSVFFTQKPVFDYRSAKKCNTQMYAKYCKSMLEKGIYLPPSQFEAFFISHSHTDEDIDLFLQKNKEILGRTGGLKIL